ncbi:MAG: hypothetical protein M3430_08595 [Acidobacteriota bacterium]|nr:hypothetical protein [Acidobacteriota bacterium]
MIHEKCGKRLRYVTMYTVITTKSVQEADAADETAFVEVTDEEMYQATEVYCNICNQKLNLHETEIVRHNLYGVEAEEERAVIKDRWRKWQNETVDLEE